MAWLSTPQRSPVDDLELGGSPELTGGDRATLDAIRRQLEAEYPGPAVEPSASAGPEPAVVPLRAPSRSGWGSPAVAALVTLAAVGGGIVGATIAVQILPDPGVVKPVTTETASPPGPVTPAAPAAPPAPAAPAAPPAPAAPAAPPAPPAPVPPRLPRVVPGPSMTATAKPEPPADLPERPRRRSADRLAAAPEAPAPAPPPAPARTVTRSTPVVAPPTIVAGSPPPRLERTRAAFGPSGTSSVSEPVDTTTSPSPSRDGRLSTAIREDWETVKRGFASAPADLKRAWRAFTRDVKDLFDR